MRSSTTRELKNPKSEVRLFFEAKFPDLSVHQSKIRRELRNGAAFEKPTHGEGSIVGTAFDYRLRWFLENYDLRDTVAFKGGRFLCKRLRMKPALMNGFFDHCEERAAALNKPGSLPDIHAEMELCNIAAALAYFEQVFRNGILIFSSPLCDRTVKTVNDILAIAGGSVIADLIFLSHTTHKRQPQLIRPQTGYVLNPKFVGSVDMAADGDVIVDHMLVDIKTTSEPCFSRIDIYQLAAYYLLDYDDQYEINALGLYFARPGVLISWPVPVYFSLLTTEKFDVYSTRSELQALLRRQPDGS